MLTAYRVRNLLQYDSETGIFKYRVNHDLCDAGDIAGYVSRSGRKMIWIDGRTYSASRLAFVYKTGRWPTPSVDHINRNKSDDRWCNLREATMQEQALNQGLRKTNTSGYKNVYKNPGGKGWLAFLPRNVDNRRKYIGRFDSPAEAAQAIVDKIKEIYTE